MIPGEVGEGRSSRDFYMLQERSIALLFHVASLGSRREPPAVPERFQWRGFENDHKFFSA